MKKFIIILITSTLLLAQTPIHNVKFIGNWDASQMPGILGEVNGGTGVANTVTIKVCSLAALTPTASTYLVKVIK